MGSLNENMIFFFILLKKKLQIWSVPVEVQFKKQIYGLWVRLMLRRRVLTV